MKLEIALYCVCGNGLEASVEGTKEALTEVDHKVRAMWNETHEGSQHAPCSRKEAIAAKKRKERLGID